MISSGKPQGHVSFCTCNHSNNGDNNNDRNEVFYDSDSGLPVIYQYSDHRSQRVMRRMMMMMTK